MGNNNKFNVLLEPCFSTVPEGTYTLPGVLAALSRDEVDSFPALRAHQLMFWHMFLVQLAALALNKASREDIPKDEATWATLVRGLTPDFPDDEPWCLVVEDQTKPAFMQAPVPNGLKWTGDATTPDALDLLITSKNHDLKMAVAQNAKIEDWVFALISLQTGEGFGGSGNQGIMRMNGGSSSRSMLTFAPMPESSQRDQMPRLGAWFARDVKILLENRGKCLILDYPSTAGLGLTWLAPWPEGSQLKTKELDCWFIEICRRVRLSFNDERITAKKGTSKDTRIDAKHLKGAVGDPWALIHKTESKAFTLSESDLDYRTLTELLFSGKWELPLLAQASASSENRDSPVSLIAMALSRGNSKTFGMKSRIIPVSGKIRKAFGQKRDTLNDLAKNQSEIIATFSKALRSALALAAAGGDREKRKKGHYSFSNMPDNALTHYADTVFFDYLWKRLDAQDEGPEADKKARNAFILDLWENTQQIFEQALPTMPCPSLFRPRAYAIARKTLKYAIKDSFQSDLGDALWKDVRHDG